MYYYILGYNSKTNVLVINWVESDVDNLLNLKGCLNSVASKQSNI